MSLKKKIARGGGGAARPSAACASLLAQKNQNAAVAVADRAAVQRRLEWLSRSAGIFSYFTGGKDFAADALPQRTPLRMTKRRRLAPLPPAGRRKLAVAVARDG